MKRIVRNKLCEMSEKSFGSKYAWLSYLRTPYYVKEMVATSNGKMRQVKVSKWRTLDEVINLMTEKVEPVVETKEIVVPE